MANERKGAVEVTTLCARHVWTVESRQRVGAAKTKGLEGGIYNHDEGAVVSWHCRRTSKPVWHKQPPSVHRLLPSTMSLKAAPFVSLKIWYSKGFRKPTTGRLFFTRCAAGRSQLRHASNPHTGDSERRKTQQHQLFMPVVAAAAAAAAAADDMGDARNTQVKTWAAIGGPGRGHRTVGCRVNG